MKYNGITLDPPKARPLVIPHGDNEIVFMIKPIYDLSEFKELSPMPEPPMIVPAEGDSYVDYDDKKYDAAFNAWSMNQSRWVQLKSLEDSPGISWDTVDMANPDTYENYVTELEEAGFTIMQINILRAKILEYSGMSQQLIMEATERFIAGREQESQNK